MVESIFRWLSGAGRQPCHARKRLEAVPPAGLHGKLLAIFHAASDVNRSIFFAAGIIIAGFIPLFTLSGVEGHIFGPMAKTYAYALAGGLLATFTITPALSALILPAHVEETETLVMRVLHRMFVPALRFAMRHKAADRVRRERTCSFLRSCRSAFLASSSCRSSKKAICGFARRCRPRSRLKKATPTSTGCVKLISSFPEVESVVSQHGRPDDGTDAAGFFNAEFFAPLKPTSEWPAGVDKDDLTVRHARQAAGQFPRRRIQLLAISAGQRRRSRLRREGRKLDQAVWQRPSGADRNRRQDQKRAGDRAGRHRSVGVYIARPADGADRRRSRARGALRPRAGRHQFNDPGGHWRRQRGRRLRAQQRPPFPDRRAAGAAIPAIARSHSRICASACRAPTARRKFR